MLRFQIVDHGCDGAQYFPGCGVAFTPYTDCVTGIGDSAREAGDDALEQLHMTIDRNDLTTDDAERLEAAVRDLSNVDDASEVENPEWHHYVTIRWACAEDDEPSTRSGQHPE